MKRNYADGEEAAKETIKVKWRLQKEQEERPEERRVKEDGLSSGSRTDGATSAERSKVVVESRFIKGSKGIKRSSSDKDTTIKYGGIDGKNIKQEETDESKVKMVGQGEIQTRYA